MKTTYKLSLDLTKPGTNPRIQAVQGDLYTRFLEIALFSDGIPWLIPDDATLLIRYQKPDRTIGQYDTLPNGLPAYTVRGNTVTITVAPDVLTLPGGASLILSLFREDQALSTFEIAVDIQPNHGAGSISQGLHSSVTGLLPAPDCAKEGQILLVEEVSESGTIRKLRASDLPDSGVIVTIQENVASVSAQGIFEYARDGKAVWLYYPRLDAYFHLLYVDGYYAWFGYVSDEGISTAIGVTEEAKIEEYEFQTPSALPNPQPLTINGTSYTGLQAKNVETREFLVTLSGSAESGWSADHTLPEIIAANLEGRVVTANMDGQRIPLFNINGDCAAFLMMLTPGNTLMAGVFSDGSVFVEYWTAGITINGNAWIGEKDVDFTDTIHAMIDAKAPTALPSPHKLILTGAVSAEYDGSGEVTVQIPTVGSGETATETVLSDNLFDPSTVTEGQLFYHSSSGPVLTDSDDVCWAYVPLRGAGTYRTKVNYQEHGSYATRVPILTEDKTFLQNVTGTVTETDNKYAADLEFTITQEMVDSGAALYAFDCHTTILSTVMIVRNREYPSSYIAYGYVEVPTEEEEANLVNPLRGKTAVFLGDSICAGTTVGEDSEYYGYGWAGMIGEPNGMTWTNYGRNGGTVTNLEAVAEERWLSTQADTAYAAHPEADYVIFEGGCNDADQMKADGLGEIASDYATFDTSTFSGALESLILKILTAWPTAKVGYIIPQKMYNSYPDYTAENHIHRKYFERAIAICEKWGIPCLDLWKCNPLNPMLSTAGTFYVEENGQHLTLAGYQRITPQIEGWMRTL